MRPFSTCTHNLSQKHKSPSLADITPDSVSSYKANLAAYREKVKSATASEISQAAATAAAEKAGTGNENTNDSPFSGVSVKSLLYGSPTGKREEAEMEQSYGKVLARGKYVHEIVFHMVKPDRVGGYVELIGEEYPRIAEDKGNNVHLVGSWKVEIGDSDTFVHIWEYNGYAGYHQTLNRLAIQPPYQNYAKTLPTLIRSRTHDLMQEFSFWPTSPPRSLGGIFELRTYTLHPGNLLEWETHWRRGLEARKNVMEGVGAWFTQVGSLNMVHHLWQFGDLRDRQLAREASWSKKGWSETVHKTVSLIGKMQSRILVPLPWSPVR
ncbi:hypothetical protein BDZ91DRAFT_769602 [Kalaharituber pfeilii]|nr:hypothetical protein BDZ91DRAFT_769602 [Kalaharituber pfeilii]